MTERINARIDAELARKIESLKELTSKSTTEIVKDAIEAYHRQLVADRGAAQLLDGFIASGEGPSDLSSNYKAELTLALGRKQP
jgi:hypothetical protein